MRQKASKYQMSILPPGKLGADTVRVLLVHEILRPSAAPVETLMAWAYQAAGPVVPLA